MSEAEAKSLQLHVSGPLRLAILKKDPIPAKLLPSRDACISSSAAWARFASTSGPETIWIAAMRTGLDATCELDWAASVMALLTAWPT